MISVDINTKIKHKQQGNFVTNAVDMGLAGCWQLDLLVWIVLEILKLR